MTQPAILAVSVSVRYGIPVPPTPRKEQPERRPKEGKKRRGSKK